jgi:transcriptional regulator with XRE-family HTH domain
MYHIRAQIFHINQLEFAKLAGATQSMVSRWEAGVGDPKLSHLRSIREAARRRRIPWDDSWFFEVFGVGNGPQGRRLRARKAQQGNKANERDPVPNRRRRTGSSAGGHAQAARTRGIAPSG